MCMSTPKPSSPPPPPPLPPAPPAPVEPIDPAPAPEPTQSADYNPAIKQKKSKKESTYSTSKGTSQLKIGGVNTGGSSGGLNV